MERQHHPERELKTYHLHLLHAQLFAAFDGHSLLLDVLQRVVSHRGAEADHHVHPERQEEDKMISLQKVKGCVHQLEYEEYVRLVTFLTPNTTYGLFFLFLLHLLCLDET